MHAKHKNHRTDGCGVLGFVAVEQHNCGLCMSQSIVQPNSSTPSSSSHESRTMISRSTRSLYSLYASLLMILMATPACGSSGSSGSSSHVSRWHEGGRTALAHNRHLAYNIQHIATLFLNTFWL